MFTSAKEILSANNPTEALKATAQKEWEQDMFAKYGVDIKNHPNYKATPELNEPAPTVVGVNELTKLIEKRNNEFVSGGIKSLGVVIAGAFMSSIPVVGPAVIVGGIAMAINSWKKSQDIPEIYNARDSLLKWREDKENALKGMGVITQPEQSKSPELK